MPLSSIHAALLPRALQLRAGVLLFLLLAWVHSTAQEEKTQAPDAICQVAVGLNVGGGEAVPGTDGSTMGCYLESNWLINHRVAPGLQLGFQEYNYEALIPLYATVRYHFNKKSKVQVFGLAKAGWAVGWSNSPRDEHRGGGTWGIEGGIQTPLHRYTKIQFSCGLVFQRHFVKRGETTRFPAHEEPNHYYWQVLGVRIFLFS